MPFRPPSPHAFSLAAIRTHVPAGPGVYGISNAREWIYIGQTDNLQTALLGHLAEENTAMKARMPTGFSCESCDPALMSTRQDRLVMEYEPMFNRKTGL